MPQEKCVCVCSCQFSSSFYPFKKDSMNPRQAIRVRFPHLKRMAGFVIPSCIIKHTDRQHSTFGEPSLAMPTSLVAIPFTLPSSWNKTLTEVKWINVKAWSCEGTLTRLNKAAKQTHLEAHLFCTCIHWCQRLICCVSLILCRYMCCPAPQRYTSISLFVTLATRRVVSNKSKRSWGRHRSQCYTGGNIRAGNNRFALMESSPPFCTTTSLNPVYKGQNRAQSTQPDISRRFWRKINQNGPVGEQHSN